MPRGREPEGEAPLSNAERQARYRARHKEKQASDIVPPRRPIGRRTRVQRWHAAVAELVENAGVRARGARAEAGVPVRAAQPLRSSLSPQHHAPAVRPFWALAGSVAAVAARRLDRG
jgi:hypothetical protein